MDNASDISVPANEGCMVGGIFRRNPISENNETIDHWRSPGRKDIFEMFQQKVEYKLVPAAAGKWRIYRGGLPIAIRQSIFDAAEIATLFAAGQC